MSASFLSEIKGGAGARDPLDDKMGQIRELLFGEFKRDSDARIALIEARLRELDSGLNRKLDAIQARLETIAVDLKSDRKAAFEDLSESVGELAERIRRIAADA